MQETRRTHEDNDERKKESERTPKSADATASDRRGSDDVWRSRPRLNLASGGNRGGDFQHGGIDSSRNGFQSEPEARLRSAYRRQTVQRGHKDHCRQGAGHFAREVADSNQSRCGRRVLSFRRHHPRTARRACAGHANRPGLARCLLGSGYLLDCEIRARRARRWDQNRL